MAKPLPYLFMRLLLGMSLFGHGLVRLPKLRGFSTWMTGQFKDSILPESLVQAFSYLLPFAEFITGLLLLIGLFTKQAAIAAALIMLALIFGSSMAEEWGSIPTQLLHGAFAAYLLQYTDANNHSLDSKFKT